MNVLEIWRYPIKSIGGERVTSADVTPLGIQGDRRWGVMDTATGNILTARRTPKLLMATASLVGERPVIATNDGDSISGSLVEMSESLSDWLGLRVELMAGGAEGGTYENPMDVDNETDWMTWTGPGHALHDSPHNRLSLVSAATVGDRDVRRFRINLVLGAGVTPASDGGVGGGEDGFVGRRIRVGSSVELDVTEQISRCIMVTRAQPGLTADREVLKRVVRERSNMMGVGSLVATGGLVHVGDQVTVIGSGTE